MRIVFGAVIVFLCAAVIPAQPPPGGSMYTIGHVESDRQLKVGVTNGAHYWSYNSVAANTEEFLIQKLNGKGLDHVAALSGPCCNVTINLLEMALSQTLTKGGFDLSATVTVADAAGQQLYFKGYHGEGRAMASGMKKLLAKAAENLAENIANDPELIRLLTEKRAASAAAVASSAVSAAPVAVKIGSIPAGAEIEIDGAFSGNTPSTFKLAPGSYRVALAMEGYEKWERTMKVGDAPSISVNAELSPVAAAPPSPPPVQPPAPPPAAPPGTIAAQPESAEKPVQQVPTPEPADREPATPSGPAPAPSSPADRALASYRQCIANIGDGSLIVFTLKTASQTERAAAPEVSQIGFALGSKIRKGEVIGFPHAIDAAGPVASVFRAGELDGKEVYFAALKPGPTRLFSAFWFADGTNLLTQGVQLDPGTRRAYVLGDITVEMNFESATYPGEAGSAAVKWSKDERLAAWFTANYLRKAPSARFVTVEVAPRPILPFHGAAMKAFSDGNYYSFSDFRTDGELISAVKDPKDDPGDRANAIGELGSRRSRAAVGPLTACLTDPEPKIRERAIEALGKIGGEDAVRALKEVAAGNGDASLRNKAGKALEEIEADSRLAAVNKLTDQAELANIARTDQAARVRGAAVNKLTDEALLAEIERTESDGDVRAQAQNRLNHLRNQHK